ncbi:MAG TPA: hypothetical protein VGI39_00535 [Polyangiaceae bacterium]
MYFRSLSLARAHAIRFGCLALALGALGACTAPTGNATESVASAESADTTLESEVKETFVETLGRPAQDWEVAVWVQRITSGQDTLYTMRRDFVNDAQCASAITKVYQDTLARTPSTSEIDTWRQNIYVGWSIASMRAAFVQDPQCASAITKVYQDALARTPSAGEIDYWRSQLDGVASIASMRANFVNDSQCVGAITEALEVTLKLTPPIAGWIIADWQSCILAGGSIADIYEYQDSSTCTKS